MRIAAKNEIHLTMKTKKYFEANDMAKQRGRPKKIFQYAGLPTTKPVPKRLQATGSGAIEFNEEQFMNWITGHPQPRPPPARAHQSEHQHSEPEPADEPSYFGDNAFETVSNESVEYPSDTDTDTAEDFEFCVVGEDGLLHKDTSSKHHQRERQKFIDFDNHKAGLLAEYAKLVTANLTSSICSVNGCENMPVYRCYTCRTAGILKSAHCEVHARIHWKETMCHRILDASDQPLQCNSRRLDCCEMSPVHRAHVVQLSTQDCSEQVECHTCCNHNVSSLLMGLGFMVNKCAKPDHAFAIPMVHVALKARIHGTSYESCAGIFFSDSSKSARNKGLYQPFMDAVRFFSGLSQAVQHGTVHAPDTLGWGKTVCPMCEGNGDGEYPLVLKQMDGFESARKRAVEYGGGHNHGHYSWAQQFWYKPGEDYVARASEKGRHVAAGSLGCSSRHHSGEEDKDLAKKRTQQSQYDRIVHQGCMHDFFERIFNAKGERLLYCDTVIQQLREQYPNRELALSYDVICKEVAHLQQPYMQQTNIETPYIAVLPVMHAQAHSKECQVKFSPRIIAGLGTKLDEGNRELDISLIAEDYNCSKLRSALKIIAYKLDLAYVDLASIEGTIGEGTVFNRGSYRGFIEENNTWQINLMTAHCIRKSVMTSVEEEAYLLREQADDRGRTIARTRKILTTHVGTNVASKLRRHLKSQYNQLNSILSELNNLGNMTSNVSTKQIIDELDLKGRSDEAYIQKYWRGLEDIYHWRHALLNFIKFYEKRVDNQNGQWVQRLEAVDASDSPLLCKDAFKAILRRKLSEEMGFLERGRDLECHYTSSRQPFHDSHLDQVHEGFKLKLHKLHFQLRI
ncbi:hypothetical protein CcCBS67573_g00104 [Chytriomyces confervae]|uniref:CxC2-like cysteine cluster KDZ transposase-associated domain-containing protein n=1 Tax=Chytriomyces confervae TaxID=246404 RepID=A0A507FR39_9FUNG|nr:hypothetical protein CcCBS67573_g00104 [Chytriomyces confervae]